MHQETATTLVPSVDLKAPVLNKLYEHWLTWRGSRRMPSRADIDPFSMPKLLPNLMLIDVSHEPMRFRYRVVGTNVVAATGEDRTGQDFDATEFMLAYPFIREQYVAVVSTGEPLYSLEPFRRRDSGKEYQVERLMLPLSRTGSIVEMILVGFHFDSIRASQSGHRGP
jgi:hypothetical protein